MEVEYELTRDDLYAFQWRAAFTSSLGKRTRRQVYIAWFVALLLVALLPAIGRDGLVLSRANFTFLLVAYPIVALLQWSLEKWMMRRALHHLLDREKPGRGQLGRHKILLTEDGVVESTAVNESRTSWAGIDRVERNDQYIFIYTSPAAAHLVPTRAFSDPRDAEAFYQLSKARKEAAPGRQAAP